MPCIRKVICAFLVVPVMVVHSFLSDGHSLGTTLSRRGQKVSATPRRRITAAGVQSATRAVEKKSGAVCPCSDSRSSSIDREPIKQKCVAGAEEIVERLVNDKDCGAGVFYNRVGSIGRDLGVLMANVLAQERSKERHRGVRKKGLRFVDDESTSRTSDTTPTAVYYAAEECEKEEGLVVLDAFAASGVRALRYLTEVPGVRRVVANDYDTSAIEFMRQAADLCGAGEEFEVRRGDALDVMYAARAGGLGTYDIVDIDPYGESAPFLDASVQAVKDGGLLCVTSTDMPVLSGVQPEAAYARYGSVPTRGGYHQEMSLRILLHAISAAAARQRRCIKPVLSVAIDHYVRVFVRVFRSPEAALAASRSRASYVLQSEACPSFFVIPVLPQRSSRKPKQSRFTTASPPTNQSKALQPSADLHADEDLDAEEVTTRKPPFGGKCPETGSDLKPGGPIWSGPLHDEAWVERAIALVSSEGIQVFTASGEKYKLVSSKTAHESICGSSSLDESVGEKRLEKNAEQIRPRLAAQPRVESLLKAVSRELHDVPLFYNLKEMFATMGLRLSPRREQVMCALENAGFRTSGMHKEPLALKTDAPDAAVWDILRCWVRDNPQPPPVRSAGRAILARGPQIVTNATFVMTQTGVDGWKRRGNGGFLHTRNPQQGWGPLARGSVMAVAADAPGKIESKDKEEKRGKSFSRH